MFSPSFLSFFSSPSASCNGVQMGPGAIALIRMGMVRTRRDGRTCCKPGIRVLRYYGSFSEFEDCGDFLPKTSGNRFARSDRFNQRGEKIRVLKSAEVDILADGSLDYDDDLLRELDYTVSSIHSRFSFGKEKQTERVLRGWTTAISTYWVMPPDGCF